MLYSYAIHLRKGSYRTLPYSNASATSQYISLNGSARNARFAADDILGDEDDTVDDFYRVPTSATVFANQGSSSQPPSGTTAFVKTHHATSSSLGSFTDFVSAPGRGRRVPGRSQLGKSTTAAALEEDVEDEVLFDSDGLGGAQSSRFGTDETTSVSSKDEEGRRTPLDSTRHGQYSRERYSTRAGDRP